MKRLARMTVVLAAGAQAVLGVSPAAHADTPWDPQNTIRSAYNGKCLDIDLAHLHEGGQRVQLWDCWNDPGNQRWLFIPNGNGVYRIMNGDSGQCIGLDRGHLYDNGALAEQWPCSDSLDEYWNKAPTPNPNVVEFVNSQTFKCLDLDLSNPNANGARIQQWDCWNDPGNQGWLT